MMTIPRASESLIDAELHLFAVEDDRAVVRPVPVDAGQDLHQGRLAGPVLAADGVDLASLDGDRHVLQGLDAGERLGDGLHLQNGCCHAAGPSLRVVMGHAPRRPDGPAGVET